MAAKVGEYLLLDTIGHGAFGKVKIGVHQETGERVAVKIMDKSDIQKQDLTQNVRREITIMKALNHKNIVRLYQVLTTSTKIYVVMELVTGGELLDVISRHKHGLKERAARRYFQQLVDGVVYCHRRKVYHRDLKPENILLSESKEVKVTDFGLSSITRSKQGEKDERFLKTQCGTPCYVAPEVIYAAAEGYSGEKADGWACGIVLYALLTGSLPFDSDELGELFMMIMNTEPHYPDHLSKGAKDLLKKILHKDPKRRIGLRQVRQHPWFLKNYEGDADEGSRPRRKKQRRVEEDASTNNPAILDGIASPLAEGGNASPAAQDISASVSERTDGEIETSPEKQDMDVVGVSQGLQSPGRSLVANIASIFEARDKEDEFVPYRPSPKKDWTRRVEPEAPSALPLSANLENMTGGSTDGEHSNERAFAHYSKAGTLSVEADENVAAPVTETTSPENHEEDTAENVGDMMDETVRVSDRPNDAAGDGGFEEEDPAHAAVKDDVIMPGNMEAAHEDLDPPEDERMDEGSTDGVHTEKQDIRGEVVDYRSQMSVTDIMENGIFGRPSLQWVGSPSRVLKQAVFAPMEDKRDSKSATRSGATVGFDLGNGELVRDSCRFEDEDAEDSSLHGSSQAVWAGEQPTTGLAKSVGLGAGGSSVSYCRPGTTSIPGEVEPSMSDGLDALRRKFEDYECMDSGPDEVEILSRDQEAPRLTRETAQGEIAAERDGKEKEHDQAGERTDIVAHAASRLQAPSVELPDREGTVAAERGSSSVSADHDSDRAQRTVEEGNGGESREAHAFNDTREDSSPKRDDEDDEEAYEIIEEIPDTDSEEEAEYIEIEVPILASALATSGSEDRPPSRAMMKDIAQLTLQPKNLEEDSRERSEEFHVAERGEEEAVDMDGACDKGVEDVVANSRRLEEEPCVVVDENRRGTHADPRSEKGAMNERRVDTEEVNFRGFNGRAEVVDEETSDGEDIEFFQTTTPAASLQARYALEGHEIRMGDVGESPNTSKRDFGYASRQGFETSGEVEVVEIPAADLAEFERRTNDGNEQEHAGTGKVKMEDGAMGLPEDVDMSPGGGLDSISVGEVNDSFGAEGTLADGGASYDQNENGAQIVVDVEKGQRDVDMIPEELVDEIEEEEEDDDEIGEGLTKLTSEQQGEFFAIRRLQTVIAMAKTADLEKKDRKSFSRVVSFRSSSKPDDPSRQTYLEDRKLTLSALNTVKDKLQAHPDLAAALTDEEMREFEKLVQVWEMQLQESSFSHVEQPVVSEEMVVPLQKLLRVWDANLTGSFAAEEVEDVGKNSSHGGDSEVWEDDEFGSSEEEVVVDREFDVVGDEVGQGADRSSGLCEEGDDTTQGAPMKLGSKSAVLVGNRKELADPRSASLPDVQAPPAGDSSYEGQGEDENADSRTSSEVHGVDRVEPKLSGGVLGSDSMDGLLDPKRKGKMSGKKMPNISLTNSVVRDSARFRVPEDVETRSPVGAENSPAAYAATGSSGWSGGAVSPLKESNASRVEDGPSSGGGLFVGQAFSGDQTKKKPAQRGVVRKWKNLVGFKQQRKYTQFDTAYSPDLALQEMGKLFLRDTDADNVFKRQNENKLKCSVKTARGQMMVTVEFFAGKGARGSTLVLFKQSKPSTDTITFNNFFDSAKESFATLAPNAVLE